jgi:DNA primase
VGIVDEDVVRVRESTDFVKVAQDFIQLKKAGARWTGLCPFHSEKSPSFSVNAELGLYYCFGCQAKGDVITFVMELQHLDFVGAVEYLAGRAGVVLRYTDKDEGAGRKQRNRLTEVLKEAVDWYHQRLLTSPDAGAARRYLRDRGLDGDEVRRFQIGFAPDDWDQLARHLKLPNGVLTDTGLGFINKRNRQQDFFRNRVLFPIFDAQGSPVSFGGRALPGGDPPKYKNTAETKLYSKSKVLYGLNWSKDAIVKADEVIVCEGYTDVIGFAAVGLGRAVATCGTALTEEHVRQLTRFAKRVVLGFDPDAAGNAAAERFYAWEKKYSVDVAVADLPPGQDPGDLSRSDPERLRAAVESATPFLGFRVERALAAADLRTPEGRGRAAEAALAVIREHPSEFVRDQYVMEVADRTRLEPDRLRTSLANGGARIQADATSAAQRAAASGRDTKETMTLRLAVQQPDVLLPLLHEVLFTDDRNVAAFRALRDAGGDLHAALEVADPGAAELLQRLAVEESGADPLLQRRDLLRERATAVLAEVREQSLHDLDHFADYPPVIKWLQEQVAALSEDLPQRAVEDQLVGWLVTRSEGST